MQVFKFHRSDTGMFKEQQIALVYEQERYLPFITNSFSVKSIEEQIVKKGRKYAAEQRELISTVLQEQYVGIDTDEKVDENLELLGDPNTFTITTGHQLSLFTGPLYFVIKILHAIKLCEELKVKFPEKNFVPVYWMASEDHDFEEINHLTLFNQRLEWNHAAGGPVGRMDTNGLEEIRAQLHDFFSTRPESEIHELIDSYRGNNLSEATRRLLNKLFGKYGLLILDGDDEKLKRTFVPYMEKELSEQFSYKAVTKTNKELEKSGAKIQVMAREVNLFYIEDNSRERIVFENGRYQIEGKGNFTEEEIIKLLRSQPCSFSPNVVLRPLFQEVLLPNLAYIGGAGEIAYWLQLKGVFDTAGIPYPLIQVRNSVLWVDRTVSAKKEKFDIQLQQIFKPTHALKQAYIEQNEESLEFDELDEAAEKLTSKIDELVSRTDESLIQYASAEISRINKQLEGIKAKMIRVSKSRHTEAMSAVDFIKDRLFPSGKMQEREVSFFHFCPQGNTGERLELLYSAIDPFEKDLIIIREA